VDYDSTRQVVIDTKAQHYRNEAARIIEIAERAGEASIRIQLLEIAQRYLQLALSADAVDARPAKKPVITSGDRG
jgi:hypothetical protein